MESNNLGNASRAVYDVGWDTIIRYDHSNGAVPSGERGLASVGETSHLFRNKVLRIIFT